MEFNFFSKNQKHKNAQPPPESIATTYSNGSMMRQYVITEKGKNGKLITIPAPNAPIITWNTQESGG